MHPWVLPSETSLTGHSVCNFNLKEEKNAKLVFMLRFASEHYLLIRNESSLPQFRGVDRFSNPGGEGK